MIDPLSIFFDWMIEELYANAQWYARVLWGVNPSWAHQSSLISRVGETEATAMSDAQTGQSGHSAKNANAAANVSVPATHEAVTAAASRSLSASERSRFFANWTEGRVARLRDLWAQDLTVIQIAAEFGDGFTPGAISGQIHRLGLPTRSGKPRAPRRPRGDYVRASRAKEPMDIPRITLALPRVVARPIDPDSIAGLEAAMRTPLVEIGIKNRMDIAASRFPAISACTPLPDTGGDADPAPIASAVEETDPGFKCEPVTILDLQAHHCRWVLSHPSDEALYCGRRKRVGYGSFCPAHSAIAYHPLALKRADVRPHYR
jgi:hypothetical protein